MIIGIPALSIIIHYLVGCPMPYHSVTMPDEE